MRAAWTVPGIEDMLLEGGANVTTDPRIASLAETLRAGGVVAFPTETVYGLGADATQPDAVRAIFALKGRPADHPLIAHVLDAAWLDRWGRDVPDLARRFAEAFWPGPLTLVVRRSPEVCEAVTGGLETVGLRAPAHPLAHALLAAVGRPLAAPSANRFGRVSPTSAAHVRDEFGDAVPVLDGGDCAVGVESTIVDLSAGHPRILRPGGVTADALSEVAGAPVEHSALGPRVPGTLPSHYAPAAEVVLVEPDDVTRWLRDDVGVLACRPVQLPEGTRRIVFDDPEQAAHGIYRALRTLDAAGCRRIVVVPPKPEGVGVAVRDRLRRAAAPRP